LVQPVVKINHVQRVAVEQEVGDITDLNITF